MTTVTKTYNGNELVIQGKTIGQRAKENRLRRALRLDSIKDADRQEIALYAALYLSYVKEGDIGINIPTEHDTLDTVNTFIDEWMSLDGELLDIIDDGIRQTRIVTNGPDLLPPNELSDAKKKTQKSSKSA